MKKVNYEKYEHDYLGKETGTGGEVFTNLIIKIPFRTSKA